MTAGNYAPREVFLVPPRDLITPEMPLQDAMNVLYSWGDSTLKHMGTSAHTLSPHLFHIKKEFQQTFNDEASARGLSPSGRKLNRYDILREHLLDGHPFGEYCEFYPHLPAIAYGRVDQILRPPGCVVRTNPRPISSLDLLTTKLFYILSHAPVLPGLRSIRDYGLLRKLTLMSKTVDFSNEMCPNCGDLLVDSVDLGPVLKRTCIYTYAWKPKSTSKVVSPPCALVPSPWWS